MTEHVQALLGKVIIEREKAEESISVLYIPEESQEKPWAGRVHSVGEGYYDMKTQKWIGCDDLKPGDRVLIEKYSGYRIEINKKEHQVVPYDQVICGIPEGVDVSSMNVKSLSK